MTKVAAVILAGGSGKRMGGALPKQFLELEGKPILQHTLECFNHAEIIDEIYVVLPEAYIKPYEQKLHQQWGITKTKGVVCGGGERHQSVWAGITALPESIDIVMIHDGVRPFVSERILVDSVHAAKQYGAAVVGLMPRDTIKLFEHDKVERTIDRNK
ncbi:MAG: 2-C-methyl-D-erythritol 4-phosphate cytidylyltransferase, partial [Calditrichaeota bacterium]